MKPSPSIPIPGSSMKPRTVVTGCCTASSRKNRVNWQPADDLQVLKVKEQARSRHPKLECSQSAARARFRGGVG